MGGKRLYYILMVLCILTVSTVSASGRWRFVVVGDSQGSFTGVNGPILSELVREILRHDVDLVIFTGDLVSGVRAAPDLFEAQLWEWIGVMEPVYRDGIAVYVCRGNHEVMDVWDAVLADTLDPTDNCALRWLAVFGNGAYPQQILPDNGPVGERCMTYAIEHENALVVGLDLYAGQKHRLAHSLNQDWLDSVLESNTKPHVFVFGHEPAFGTYHEDCLDAYPDRRDAFWMSLERAGGRMYFCGHDHYYDHAVVEDGDGDPNNNIHQIIAGTGGGAFYTWAPPYDGDNGAFTVRQRYHAKQHGYMLVDVEDLDVTVTWMERWDGAPFGPTPYIARDWWRYHVSLGLTLLRPRGAARLAASESYTVRWKTVPSGATARVVLEYSLDGGASWQLIDVVDNTGSYEWFVPTANSASCLLRVRDADEPTNQDTSDTVFSVFECQAKLAADLNGDCYVDFADLAILMNEWLACGNPLDSACGFLK
jgi:Calcineurin-like phosphoesterase